MFKNSHRNRVGGERGSLDQSWAKYLGSRSPHTVAAGSTRKEDGCDDSPLPLTCLQHQGLSIGNYLYRGPWGELGSPSKNITIPTSVGV